jgi:hypothetical protein
VVPQWLIKKTGHLKRIFQWGQMTEDGLNINQKIPFDQFKFPSCITCNDKYSKLEAQAKIVFEKIELETPVSVEDLDKLLDWFDKIRIGIWLAQLYLNKNHSYFTPSFFIEQRIGKKDRYLAIFRRNQKVSRCSINCVATPAFEFMPSAAGFVFNDFGFISISDDYLFSKNLGWPFPFKKNLHSNGLASVILQNGINKTKKPILPFEIEGSFIQIFQAIADQELSKTDLYNNEYIKNSLMENSSNKGKTRIFNQSYNEIAPNENGLIYCTPEFSNEKDELFVHTLSIQTLKIQNYLWNNSNASNEDKNYQKNHKKMKKLFIHFNECQIKAHRKSMLKIKSKSNLQNNLLTPTKINFTPKNFYK